MQPSTGIVTVAYGDAALNEAALSIIALRKVCHLPIVVVCQSTFVDNRLAAMGVREVQFDLDAEPPHLRWGARWAKLNLDTLSPFDRTIYVDVDTRARQDYTQLLTPLIDGYDLVIAPSSNQGAKALEHVERHEREMTFDTFGFTPVQLQAGLFAFDKNPRIADFFACWREVYQAVESPTQDQAALLRALHDCPVRLWLTSTALTEYYVAHLWGRLHR